MINNLYIENFKSLKSVDLSLSPLTILTGTNGSGKSSLLQAILFLKQNFVANSFFNLDGELTDLINGKEVLFEFAEKDEITIKIKIDGTDRTFIFDVERGEPSLSVKERQDIAFAAEFKNQQTIYLCSDRYGPQKEYTYSNQAAKDQKIDKYGEMTINYLYQKANSLIPDLFLPDFLIGVKGNTNLENVLNVWLNEISPGVKFKIEQQPNNGSLNLSFAFDREDRKEPTRPYKNTQVGYGISYIMSVLVTLLSAPKDSLIIIENPEAHLHPKGQSRMGYLLALAARNGSQIIIETHSDHIVNGVAVAIRDFYNSSQEGKAEQDCNGIKNTDVSIYWFERDRNDNSSQVISVPITPNAKILDAPDGFFDQMNIDRKKILGFVK